MPYDFNTLNREKFEKLVNQILVRVMPGIKPVHGAGGDEGIDCFVGEFSKGEKDVYQHKYFCGSVGPTQRRQISNSLKRAAKSHKMKKWVLVLPKELTPSELRWFEKLQEGYASVKFDFVGLTKLADWLLKNKDIANAFFPESKILQEIKRMGKSWKRAFKSLRAEGSLKGKYDLKPRVKQMGICQLIVLGATAEAVAKQMGSSYPNEAGNDFGITKPVKKGDTYHSRLVFRKGKVSFELEGDEDEPFHLVYPRIDSFDVIFKDIEGSVTGCKVTAFSANKPFRDFLKTALSQALESNVQIQEASFDTKMKTLVQTFAHAIDTLRFDPAVIETIKQAGGNDVEKNIRKETLSGDTGLPRMDWVQKALASIKRVKKGQASDILFFRARQASRFDKTHNVTFEVHHDGRVRAFFPAHKFVTVDTMKEPLYGFLEKWL